MRKKRISQQTHPELAKHVHVCSEVQRPKTQGLMEQFTHKSGIAKKEGPTDGWAGIGVADKDIRTLAGHKSCKLGARGFR